jgi:putative transposase
MPTRETPWPHAPLHPLDESGVYFVTAATYRKQHHFRGKARLRVLHRGLLTVARDFGWQLEAWAVFSNHYHFVGHSPVNEESAESLQQMLSILHERTAKWIKGLESIDARKIWHNFRETKLTFEKSYLARLNYTHQNAVKHGLVLEASQYPWCSAGWFEQTATAAQRRTIYGFRTDQVSVPDDYSVSPDW